MPKRELSCFLCRELMYEYVAATIDSRRGEAVVRHLTDCSECKTEQEGLKGAIHYARKLSVIEIRPDYLAEISNPLPLKTIIANRLKWKSWPDPVKWTLESLAFACAVVLFVGLVGQKIFRGDSNTQEIATVEQSPESLKIANLPDQTPAEFGEDEFTDHENDVEITKTETSQEKRVASPEPEVKVVQADRTAGPAPIANDSTSSSENAVSKNQLGFLYRTRFRVNDLTVSTDELVAKIESLGGTKAGSVPLGWKKPQQSYFHFSMPEKNYSQLSEFLKKYSASGIVKEKNPRVMPHGTIRMILEVDSMSQPEITETTPEEPSPSTPPSEEGEPKSEQE